MPALRAAQEPGEPAARSGITRTVETHVSAVLRKLQLSSRYELTAWATERRLL